MIDFVLKVIFGLSLLTAIVILSVLGFHYWQDGERSRAAMYILFAAIFSISGAAILFSKDPLPDNDIYDLSDMD